jgi:hypothetical protein
MADAGSCSGVEALRSAKVENVSFSLRHPAPIMLDVDNGPQALAREANASLYDAKGMDAARTALRRGGVLTIPTHLAGGRSRVKQGA